MSSGPFHCIVHSEEELRAAVGFPNDLVNNKAISIIDEHCRNFMALSPLLFLATSDSSGHCDVSPRGDQAGFVYVVDDKHLVIPERPGNRRFDSLRNILTNPKVGIIFVIPGLKETLRINGHAAIIKDELILNKMIVQGKHPWFGIGVKVEECFVHCAKAFIRSNIWETESWPGKDDLPIASKIVADHVSQEHVTEEMVSVALKESYEKRLY